MSKWQQLLIAFPLLELMHYMGELSLNGKLHPCSGILPMAIEAKKRGIKNIIVPLDNLEEASLVKELNVFAFDNLKDVADFLQNTKPYEPITPNSNFNIGARRCSEYGKKATKELVTALSGQNTCVISGMAKGIDSYAHTYALKNEGYTQNAHS